MSQKQPPKVLDRIADVVLRYSPKKKRKAKRKKKKVATEWFCPQCGKGFPDRKTSVIYNETHYCSDECVEERKANE